MTQRNDGGPAFPTEPNTQPGFYVHHGMSLRQYAAIKLRVPDSGTDWLDDMIRQSLRTDLAAKAMQGMLTALPETLDGFDWQEKTVEAAYKFADLMLAARERT